MLRVGSARCADQMEGELILHHLCFISARVIATTSLPRNRTTHIYVIYNAWDETIW